ncbi:MAG TPA: hypothetical protein VHE78_13185 [Gemmatimonadaceae bacterium]|nr:hypothetical protein [Gemmatimonadaceae bacterium]
MTELDRAAVAERVRGAVRDVPDFPKPGIVFKDITPVFLDGELFARTIAALAQLFAGQGMTHVVP